MNGKAALCQALLLGKVVSIRTGFLNYGITNVPREIGRNVERAFGVKCERIPREGKTRFDVACHWIDYSLKKTDENIDGLLKMANYVLKEFGEAKTEEEFRRTSRMESIIRYLTIRKNSNDGKTNC